MNKSIKIEYKPVFTFAMLCLSVPIAIFFLSWLKLVVGIIATILLFAAIVFSINSVQKKGIKINISTILAVIALIGLWVFLSGQGGFFTQKFDYLYRNPIFKDLIFYNWPVKYEFGNDETLVYYIAYWLIPALFGKLALYFSDETTAWLVARIALTTWTALLIFVAYLLLVFFAGAKSKKAFFIVLAVMILFSGMDILGANSSLLLERQHIEVWATGRFQYSSMATQLCWVFNQSVPIWIATALILNEKTTKNYAVIGLMFLSTSPLPFVGMVALLLLFAVERLVNAKRERKARQIFKETFSIQNIFACVSILPIYALYYMNNTATTENNSSFLVDMNIYIFIYYVLFLILEFGIYLLILYKKENKWTIYSLAFLLTIIPLFKVGTEYDFCMRASLPLLFIIMGLVIKEFVNYIQTYDKKDIKTKKKVVALLIVFLIGCATPAVEYGSSIYNYVLTNGSIVGKYDKYSGLRDTKVEDRGNFIGENSSESLFYKYIGR